MDVKYIGETEKLILTNGKIYKVISIEKDWYRIIDDTHEDYLYPPELFEIVNGENEINLLTAEGTAHMTKVKNEYSKGKW